MQPPSRLEPSGPTRSARWLRPAVAAAAASACLALASCLLDLGSLTGGTPDGGAGSSGGSEPSSGCADTDLVCGTCSAGCPGGGCEAKVVVQQSPDVNNPRGITFVDNHLYWVNHQSDAGGGSVMDLAVGEMVPRKLATATFPVVVASSDRSIFWAEQKGIFRCPASDCEAQKTMLAGSLGDSTIQGIAVSGGSIFWTDSGPDMFSASGKVRGCKVDMCSVTMTEIASAEAFPSGIAVFGPNVYWINQGNNPGNGAVRMASMTSSNAAKSIISGQPKPFAIAADETYVYWSREGALDGAVLRCPHDGNNCGTPSIIAGGLRAPFDLALDGARVYWNNTGDNSIMSCPRAGCAPDQPLVHVSARPGMHRIAFGSRCLFWTEDGAIAKVPY